jgi:hypothetical protein
MIPDDTFALIAKMDGLLEAKDQDELAGIKKNLINTLNKLRNGENLHSKIIDKSEFINACHKFNPK